jgi:hypothetical protein
VQGVAIDATYVYWVDAGDGSVRRLLKAGGTPDVLATGQAKPLRITVDSTSLYWTNNLGGAVMVMPKAGGTPQVLAPAGQPRGIADDGAYIYWTNQTDSTVMRVPKAGGTPQVLTTVVELPLSVVVDATDVYFNTDVSGPMGQATGKLYRAPSAGGTASMIASGVPAQAPDIYALALNSTSVFWLLSGVSGGGLYMMPKAGGPPVVLPGTSTTYVTVDDALAVDECTVYFTTGLLGGPGPLLRVPIQGGAMAVHTGSAGWSLALDTTKVWSAAGSSVDACAR